MEKVARDNYEVRLQLDGFFHNLRESIIKVLSPIFQTVLRVTQMQVCGVDEAESLQVVG